MNTQRFVSKIWHNGLRVAGHAFSASANVDCSNDDDNGNGRYSSWDSSTSSIHANALWPLWENGSVYMPHQLHHSKFDVDTCTINLARLLTAQSCSKDAITSLPKKLATTEVFVQTDNSTEKLPTHSERIDDMIHKFRCDMENEVGLEMMYNDQNSEAIKAWNKAASDGSVEAIYNLALSYSSGKFVKKNEKKALKLWEKASLLGHTLSMYQLAVCLIRGVGILPDKERGMLLMEKSAKGNCPQAQFFMASKMLRNGDLLTSEKYLQGALRYPEHRKEVSEWLKMENLPNDVRSLVQRTLSSSK